MVLVGPAVAAVIVQAVLEVLGVTLPVDLVTHGALALASHLEVLEVTVQVAVLAAHQGALVQAVDPVAHQGAPEQVQEVVLQGETRRIKRYIQRWIGWGLY